MNIDWKTVKKYDDITYKKCNGVARIAFNRPEVRNAFRPQTTSELLDAFNDAHQDISVGVVLLSAEVLRPKTEFGVFVAEVTKKHEAIKGTWVKTDIIG